MYFTRMVMEREAPAQVGYDRIKYNFMESSVQVLTVKEAGICPDMDMELQYTNHMGDPRLRKMIADEHGVGVDNVILSTGSCMALFVVFATLLRPGDHILITHPNYMANIHIGRSLGCDVELFELDIEHKFQPCIEQLKNQLRKDTKLVNLTVPHNPSGAMLSAEFLKEASDICGKNGTHLLVDEAYRDLTMGEFLPHGTAFGPHVICTDTMSKGLGLPGIRTGWVVCEDAELVSKFLATKEQISICGSIVDEDYAYQVMLNKQKLLTSIRKDMMERFSIVEKFFHSQDLLEWVAPSGGVVCLPRIAPKIELDIDQFYDVLNNKYGVFVGPGRWFEVSPRHFRLGYGGLPKEKLTEGMSLILKAIQDVRKK